MAISLLKEKDGPRCRPATVAAAPQKDGDEGRPSIADDSSATDGEWGCPQRSSNPAGITAADAAVCWVIRRVTQCVLEKYCALVVLGFIDL
jgi:hypothetical protein